jgi:hypothetical protein
VSFERGWCSYVDVEITTFDLDASMAHALYRSTLPSIRDIGK